MRESIRLVWIGECAKDAGWSAIIYEWLASSQCCFLEGGDLGPVHSNHQQSSDESAEDL